VKLAGGSCSYIVHKDPIAVLGCWDSMTERLQATMRNDALRTGNLYCRFFLFFVCFAICVHAAAQQTAEDISRVRQEFSQWVAQGSRALQEGDNRTAEESFRRALALDPQSVELLNNLAISIARQGRDDEAISLYEQALKLGKNDAITRRNLGVAYFRAHQYRDALPLLRSFAAATPTFQSLDLTGLDLFALDQFSAAADYLDRASRLQPDDLPTLDILGKAYWRAKNYSGVTRVFNRIMAIDPNSPEAHFMLGMAYDIEYEEPKASKEFQAALAADPNFPAVHSSLGLIDYREHNVPDAEAEFKQELSRNPNDPISNYMMGRILREQVQPAQAVPYLKAAIEVNPSYRDALFELGQCYIALNQPQDALNPLQKAAKVDPDFDQAHFVLGKAYRMLGRLQEATREFNICKQIKARKNVQATPGG
jgi:Flp pilus assembly protein TadD